MELKYCEHCGGLYVRERGAGGVYCEKCEAKVADLPIPKKKPGKVRLAARPGSTREYRVEVSKEELRDMEAVGGVA
jgi:uncharacterized Zn finger protein (UPF0148 family)